MTARARLTTNLARAFILAFGATALWLTRDGMNADGVAYLDASDVYVRGGWASGSGYWSPLYPMLLALARRIAGTGASSELAVAQVVNFSVFVVAFAAVEYFIWEARQAAASLRPDAPPPNDTAWLALVYGLFTLTTIGWIRVWLLTPDMCVAAIVFAIAGLGIRLTFHRSTWGAGVMLGLLLGLGYLAKAAMFPVAIVVLGTLAFVRRQALPQTAVAAAIFLAVAAPQLAYVSRLKGSPTIGDVGRLNYLWFIANVPGPVSSAFALPERLPSPTASGQTLVALDPTRGNHPAIYDIDAPIPGTLPIWYDAGHWYRGVSAPLMPPQIIRAVVRHTRVYLELFGFMLIGGVAALLTASVARRDLAATRPAWVLVVPAVAAMAMYGLVLVQSRYVAPFTVVLFAGLVPPWALDEISRRARVGLAAGAVGAALFVFYEARIDAGYWRGSAQHRADLISALNARGIGAGAKLGFIGEAYDALWARQARMRFVSLVPTAEAQSFWSLDTAGRTAVIAHMQQHGADAIVAETPPPGINTEGWERLPSAGAPRPDLIVYGGLRE